MSDRIVNINGIQVLVLGQTLCNNPPRGTPEHPHIPGTFCLNCKTDGSGEEGMLLDENGNRSIFDDVDQ